MLRLSPSTPVISSWQSMISICLNFAVVALMLLSVSGCGTAEIAEATIKAEQKPQFNWPYWRGPQLDGMSQETDWNTNWETPPETLWENNIGIGYSSVSIDQGRLYTMGHPAESETEMETMWCFDAVTGKEIWSKSYPCVLLDHLHKGGPCATPTIDGDFVYFNSREGEVRKVRATDGEVLWTLSLQEELGLDLPEWGFSCSVILNGNEIILETGSVIGVDKKTGKINWKTKPRMPGYGTPELFTFQDKPYLAAINNEGVSVVDLETHQEAAFYLWESPYATNATTPIWHDGQLFISTGYNIGCTLLDFDGSSLSEVYKNKNMRNHMNSCVLKDGYLYGVDGNSHIARTVTFNCIDWETGQIAWEQRNLGCGALTASKDHLIALSDSGELVLADLTHESFNELGRVKIMNEQCWTVPTLCNGLIYCRGAEGTLVCVDVRNK